MWKSRNANGVHCSVSTATSVQKTVPPLRNEGLQPKRQVEVVGYRPDELVQHQAVHQPDERGRHHQRHHQDGDGPGPLPQKRREEDREEEPDRAFDHAR